MASTHERDTDTLWLESRGVVRRFTDELTGTTALELQVQAAQVESDEEEDKENRQRLKLLYEDSSKDKPLPEDFDAAEIARQELQKVLEAFRKEAKLTWRQRLGSTSKSAKTKAIDVLEISNETNFNQLKNTIDTLEDSWKRENGVVYNAFKKVAGTFEEHRTILKMFPSENNYASVICGSLSCLLKAAKNHTDIAVLLSESIASVSDEVSRCSKWLLIIRTRDVRAILAGIYARMFKFYGDTMEWYLRSKLGRAIQSFNENLKDQYDSAITAIRTQIKELYREAFIANGAMTAIVHADVEALKRQSRRQRNRYAPQDFVAGHRMARMLEATWMEVQSLKWTIESTERRLLARPPEACRQDLATTCISRSQARTLADVFKSYIIGDEGHALLSTGSLWKAEDKILYRLRQWMAEDETSRTLWISTPFEAGVTLSGSSAAALSTLAAALQAETPIISHFCQRPRRDQTRNGMTIEQVGTIGLVYSLIYQLLQFNSEEEELDLKEKDIAALDGTDISWDSSLQVLRALMDRAPALMFCVIDGLNDLAWMDDGDWCGQFLEVLFARQRKEGIVFNVLLTTTGQSRTLSSYVQSKDRCMGTKKATEVLRWGSKIGLTGTMPSH
ncbi:hypothetical protein EV356DRAFT_443570 [Viridothelium virens]|uniref:Fungal STAND N-terminal Goodbye domain-containing protein n=1 Tax=Viridothelium virens TaxID=1048519 RepID=A0A6A6HE43_VIRVR|nr:hypothetical protein EV356DRAFT_443570 [Viridothelium virens]